MQNFRYLEFTIIIFSFLFMGCEPDLFEDNGSFFSNGWGGDYSPPFEAKDLKISPNPAIGSVRMEVSYRISGIKGRDFSDIVYIDGNVYLQHSYTDKGYSYDIIKFAIFAENITNKWGYGIHTLRLHVFDRDSITAGDLMASFECMP
jgi:hypothetical protein